MKKLREAEQQLQEREPLNNPEKNPYLSLLSGESWGINPAQDALGEPDFSIYNVEEFEENGTVLLRMEVEEFPYDLEMAPEVAVEVGGRLHALVDLLIQKKITKENGAFSSETQMEKIFFEADCEVNKVLLSGEDWGEDNHFVLTPAQAEAMSWHLREAGVSTRQKKAALNANLFPE